MHEDKVVIILTRPALERLIGGDSELEIRLREATVKTVINKYSKALLTQWVKEEVAIVLRKDLDAIVKETVGPQGFGGYINGLAPNARQLIKETVATEARKLVTDEVAKHVKAAIAEWTPVLQREVVSQVNAAVVAQLRQELIAKLKEIL